MQAPAPRVGLLGGTFDPVHAGHLDIGRACSSALALTEVRFLTGSQPPHKPLASASGHHRHAMVALATAPHADFIADPRELERGGVSYTVETLAGLARERPGAELFFLVGADSLRDLPHWRQPEEILRLATVVAVARAGVAIPALPAAWPRDRVIVLDHEPPPWSSTRLRNALAAGAAPAGSLPDAVADYISKNVLYAAPSTGADRRCP